jgi:hypothetical protein
LADLGQPGKHFGQIEGNLPLCICLSAGMLWKRSHHVQPRERSCVQVTSTSYDDSVVVAGLSCYLLAAGTRLRDSSSHLGIRLPQVLIPYTTVPGLIA